jgi:hypothetical protein
MNLAYAPQKALGLMVAAEAFRRVPLFEDYGRHPENTSFADVRVSYREDLAELVTEEAFLYSNSTTTPPSSPEKLVRIAGYGNSPVVAHPGRGAYFLDRIEPGVWRLEVMPDAIWVRDPYEKPNPDKHVSRIAWNTWPMRIDLPDLGADFAVKGLNDGNAFSGRARDGTVRIGPGAYLLARTGVAPTQSRDDRWENIVLKEFVAPPASMDRTYVLHEAIVEASADLDLRVSATIAAPGPVTKVELVVIPPRPRIVEATDRPPAPRRAQPGGGNTPGVGQRNVGAVTALEMTALDGFDYAVDIPGELLTAGTLRYHIVVHGAAGERPVTFPSEIDRLPTEWDFFGEPWSARIVPADAPVLLFDAAVDSTAVTADHRDVRYELVPSDRPGTSAMEVVVNDLASGEHDHSFRYFFKPKIRGRESELANADRSLVLYGRSATRDPCRLQIALVTADGVAYGASISVKPEHGAVRAPVSSLRQVRSPNIPHGYPVFIPFWSEIGTAIPFDLTQVESVMVSIGPDIPPVALDRTHGVQIERIWLE